MRTNRTTAMENDLDDALDRLAHAPVPASLATMEAGVFARIEHARRNGPPIGARMTIACAAMAMAMGVAGAATSAAMARDTAILSPLGVSQPLAPSTLLASAE